MSKCQQDIWLPFKIQLCDLNLKVEDKKTLQKCTFRGFEGIPNARLSSKGAHTDTGSFYSHGSTASASIIHALLSRFNPAQTAHLTHSFTGALTQTHRQAECVLPSGEHTNINSLTWILFQLLCFIKCMKV